VTRDVGHGEAGAQAGQPRPSWTPSWPFGRADKPVVVAHSFRKQEVVHKARFGDQVEVAVLGRVGEG